MKGGRSGGEEEKGEWEPASLCRRPKKTSAAILKPGSLCSRSGGRRARVSTTTPMSPGHQGVGAAQAMDLDATTALLPLLPLHLPFRAAPPHLVTTASSLRLEHR
jgi:hypothetical protein